MYLGWTKDDPGWLKFKVNRPLEGKLKFFYASQPTVPSGRAWSFGMQVSDHDGEVAEADDFGMFGFWHTIKQQGTEDVHIPACRFKANIGTGGRVIERNNTNFLMSLFDAENVTTNPYSLIYPVKFLPEVEFYHLTLNQPPPPPDGDPTAWDGIVVLSIGVELKARPGDFDILATSEKT